MNAPVLPKDHDEYEALAVAWAVDALEPGDLAAFEAHRVGCDECTHTVAAMLRVAAELAYAVPDAEPPADLRRRVLDAVVPRRPEAAPVVPRPAGPVASSRVTGRHRQPDDPDPGASDSAAPAGPEQRGAGVASPAGPDSVRQAGPGGDDRPGGGRVVRRDERRAGAPVGRPEPAGQPGSGPGRRRTGLGRRRALSLLAAVALVGVSAVTTWEITRPAGTSAPAVAAERVATLTTPEGNRTLATVVSRSGRADVVTDGLAPNVGKGTRFYLWGVGSAKQPEVVGTFDVTASGLHSYPVRLSQRLDDYPVLAVSEEIAGSTPTDPSPILARGPLGT